jgi:hypothetical protein
MDFDPDRVGDIAGKLHGIGATLHQQVDVASVSGLSPRIGAEQPNTRTSPTITGCPDGFAQPRYRPSPPCLRSLPLGRDLLPDALDDSASKSRQQVGLLHVVPSRQRESPVEA